MPEIITAFGDRVPRHTWITDGLPCATYHSRYGNLNGYVRLPVSHPDRVLGEAMESLPGEPFFFPNGTVEISRPRSYDYVSVPVPGGWTYGVNLEGWIGWDTNHVFDCWPLDYRLTHVDPAFIPMIRMMFDDLESLVSGHSVAWTEELVVEVNTRAAGQLAASARLVRDDHHS